MKKAILITTMVLFVSSLSAQERIKEVGLSLYDLDGFGLNYKVGTRENLWRLNSIYSSGNTHRETDTSTETDRRNFGTSFHAGREFRKTLADDFEFRYGFDVSFSYYRFKVESRGADTDILLSSEKLTEFLPGVNAVLGVNYLIKNKVVIGAEVLPGLSYKTGKKENLNVYSGETTELRTSGLNFGIHSSSVLLVIAYRFGSLQKS